MRNSERRITKHQEPEMELEFSCHTWGLTTVGYGHTTTLNAALAVFETDRELPEAVQIELRVQWPFLLQSVCPLELLVWGTIARSEGRTTAVQIDRYEFRTRGEHSFEPAIAKGMACNVMA